jgi:hypothetical protein
VSLSCQAGSFPTRYRRLIRMTRILAAHGCSLHIRAVMTHRFFFCARFLIHRKDTASGVFPRLDRPPPDTLDRARLLLIFRRLFYRRPANGCDNRTERRSRRRNGRHQGTAARKTRSTFLCENSVAATNQAWAGSEAAAPLITTDCFLLDRSRQEIAPDQHSGKDREYRHDGCRDHNRIDGHRYLPWISRQCAELPNAIFDADQTAEK